MGRVACTGNAFLCGNGQCIEQVQVCDGDADCDNDEDNCDGGKFFGDEFRLTTHSLAVFLFNCSPQS